MADHRSSMAEVFFFSHFWLRRRQPRADGDQTCLSTKTIAVSVLEQNVHAHWSSYHSRHSALAVRPPCSHSLSQGWAGGNQTVSTVNIGWDLSAQSVHRNSTIARSRETAMPIWDCNKYCWHCHGAESVVFGRGPLPSCRGPLPSCRCWESDTAKACLVGRKVVICCSILSLTIFSTDNTNTSSYDAAAVRVQGLPAGYVHNRRHYDGDAVRVSSSSQPAPADGEDRLALLRMLDAWLPSFDEGKEGQKLNIKAKVKSQAVFSDLTNENLARWGVSVVDLERHFPHDAVSHLQEEFFGPRHERVTLWDDRDEHGARVLSDRNKHGRGRVIKEMVSRLRTAVNHATENAQKWDRRTNLRLWQTWQEVPTDHWLDRHTRATVDIPVRNAQLVFNYTRNNLGSAARAPVVDDNFRVVLKMEEGADGRGVISALDLAFGRDGVNHVPAGIWPDGIWLAGLGLVEGRNHLGQSFINDRVSVLMKVKRTVPWITSNPAHTMDISVGPTEDWYFRYARGLEVAYSY